MEKCHCLITLNGTSVSYFSPDNAWMPTICITYHAAVEEKLMKNLSLGHLLIHKTRQSAA